MSIGTQWLVSTDDPEAKTLLQSIFSEANDTDPSFVRRDGRTRSIRFLSRNDQSNGILWKDTDFDASSTVKVAIGSSNTPPTSGTFALSFNGDNTNLTTLAYNISQSALQTALNSNPAILAAGQVTVTKGVTDGDYIIAFLTDGAQNLIEIDDDALVPKSTGLIQAVQEGDGSTPEVQSLTFKQDYLAYSEDFSASSAGSINVTVNQAGSATQPSIQTVAITPTVKSGTWTAQISQAQICKVNCVANSGADKATYRFTWSGNTIVSGDFIDLYDDAGPVRVWFNIAAGGGAPSTPAGGRLKEIASGDTTTATLGANFWNAFLADSGLEQSQTTFGYGFVEIRTKVAGVYTTPATPGFTTFAFTQGSMGRLDQTSFIVYDDAGPVGVWLNLSSATDAPAALDDVTRIIQVTSVTTTATAAQVATAIATAVDADAAFVSTASSSTVTITNANAGSRSEPVQNTSLLAVSQTTAGYTIAGSFAYNAQAGDIQNVFGDYYSVQTVEGTDYAWQFVALTNGTNSTITVSDTNLEFSATFVGTLVLNTWNMALAFQATTSDEIESTLEIEVTEPGAEPVKVLNIPVTIRRDVITGAAFSNPSGSSANSSIIFLGSVDDYTGGTSSDLDGQVTVSVGVPKLYYFVHATEGVRIYLLRAGTDAENNPSIIRPDDYAASTNEKVFQSVL